MPPNRFESEVESFLEGSHGDRTHIKRADHPRLHHYAGRYCGFSRPRIPGRKGVNGFSPAKRCTEEASSAIPLRNAITEVRPRPIIPHAIPTQPNPTSTRNPQNSNDQTSNHETHSRELHATLLVQRGQVGRRNNTPHHTSVTRHHWCGGRRRDLPRCRWAAAGPGRHHTAPKAAPV